MQKACLINSRAKASILRGSQNQLSMIKFGLSIVMKIKFWHWGDYSERSESSDSYSDSSGSTWNPLLAFPVESGFPPLV